MSVDLLLRSVMFSHVIVRYDDSLLPIPIVGFKLLTLLVTYVQEELQSVLIHVYILALRDQGSSAWSLHKLSFVSFSSIVCPS